MSAHFNLSRRRFVLTGLSLAALGGLAISRPTDAGQNHTAYFLNLSQMLDTQQVSKPSLVIDQTALVKNIQTLKQHLEGRFEYRIVTKSLPSVELIKFVMENADTQKLMVFHQPFLNQIANEIPEADILMGKPMPVNAAANFYRDLQTSAVSKGFDPTKQLQWLIDSPQRLSQYQQLAQTLGIKMRLNIELDVGFHRGGVLQDDDLIQMLTLIEEDEHLIFAGLMGYEPHVAKVPGRKLALRDEAMQAFQHKLDLALKVSGKKASELTLNSAGSPTYQYYDEGNFPHNEIAAGSCLIKPSDYDLDSLSDHEVAAYIATPVLKSLPETQIPGVEGLAQVMTFWNPNRQQTFYTYGGNWQATPVSPKGLSINPVWGHSSNQEMLNGSSSIDLKADDWIFLRPAQSESVLLQFGDILAYDESGVRHTWPVFTEQSA